MITDDIIHIKGKLYSPLLFKGFFSGEVTFENTAELDFKAEKFADFDKADNSFPRSDKKNIAYIYMNGSNLDEMNLCSSQNKGDEAWIYFRENGSIIYRSYNIINDTSDENRYFVTDKTDLDTI